MDTAQDLGHVPVAIVGTGFAGLAMAVRLGQEGTEYLILERADDIGGTWRDNSYPGCKCDVPSHLYSFSFAPNPDWSQTYSPQPEIWAYLRRTAETFGVVPRIRFGHEVRSARWDEDDQRWELQTSSGRCTADALVLGQGPLSEPSIPPLPGTADFEGTVFHSARWDHDHDLTGERVAVIGTGASAIQFVPEIQPDVARLTLFQRTPPWVLPHRDRPITRAERTLYRRVPALQRAVRAGVYWTRELTAYGMTKNPKFLNPIEKLGRKHLAKAVTDAALREKLTPSFSPGCKRLLMSNDYYPALAADNVEVVTDGIAEITPTGIRTIDGADHEVDTIIFGTGFHVTDNPIAKLVTGRGGRSLAEAWDRTGMRAYNGTTVAGFPNMFMLAGPNTGIGHTSLVVMIEAQVQYVLDGLRTLRERRAASMDVRQEALDDFADEIHRKMARTVWSTGGCASWYLDAHGRNTTLWPDFTFRFVQRLRRFDAERYTFEAGTDSPSDEERTDVAG
jgi:cation diffusion facilitator CzcD-associated flavoprotein CzcO